MRLDLGIIAGENTKKFLVDLESLVARMERAAGIKPGKAQAASESDADEDTDEDEDDDFGKKTASKKTASAGFDEDEDSDTDEDEEETQATKGKKSAASDDEDEDEDESEDEDEDEEEPTQKTKGKKSKKLTSDDVNDAAKAKVQKLIKSGQPGPEARKAVLKTLKKKFDVTSVTDLKADQYAAAIKALSA